MNIDIVIVTHNAKKNLKRCVKSIRAHTRNVPYKLLIVDNNSSDGTSEFLKNIGDATKIIINKKNLGFSGAANIAIKSTRSKYIAFVDDDAEVTKNWLKRLYEKINEKSDIGIVGCKIVLPNKIICSAETYLIDWQCWPVGCGEQDKGQRDYVKEVDSVSGACWLMKKNIVKKIGLYDEQFFPCQFEDLDYCLRARQAGFKVLYDGKVSIIHHRFCRDGGIKMVTANSRKFMKKWKKVMDSAGPKWLKDKCAVKPKIIIQEFISKALKSEAEGKYTAAIKCFEKVIYLDPRNLEANHHLSMLYKRSGRPKKAKSYADKTLAIFDHIDCLNDLRKYSSD